MSMNSPQGSLALGPWRSKQLDLGCASLHVRQVGRLLLFVFVLSFHSFLF